MQKGDYCDMKRFFSIILAATLAISCVLALGGCAKSENASFDLVYITDGAVVDDNIQGEIQITVIATGFELKSQMPIEEKVENRSISAAEFFSGAFNNTKQPKAPTMSNFSDIQIPDFLRK